MHAADQDDIAEGKTEELGGLSAPFQLCFRNAESGSRQGDTEARQTVFWARLNDKNEVIDCTCLNEKPAALCQRFVSPARWAVACNKWMVNVLQPQPFS